MRGLTYDEEEMVFSRLETIVRVLRAVEATGDELGGLTGGLFASWLEEIVVVLTSGLGLDR